MRWSWAVAVFLVVLGLAAGRALSPREAAHAHGHGHWHGTVYHEHEHAHGRAPAEPMESHANQPHDHGWSDAPDEESGPGPLVAAPTRRTPWKPASPEVAPIPIPGSGTIGLDRPPPAPPPMARAGPMLPQVAALRSIVLQL